MIEAGIGRVLQRLAANHIKFDWTRHFAYAGTVGRVAAALVLRDGERLLDVGCGTGFEGEDVFHNSIHTAPMALFTLAPLRRA